MSEAIAWLVQHHTPVDSSDNVTRIRSVLRERGQMSRSQIADATGLSSSSVRASVETAVRRGIVETWIVRNRWGTKTTMVKLL